ncbi:hypothetical protein [Lentzea sp. E54]|uniref:hypothetical protein n=1 Tax=Lentzea xerophila TaxID=3435883 RepID=UPI003DA3E412
MIELTRLYQQRPGPDTSTDAVAAWYRAKGRLHEMLGLTGGPDSAQELAFAAASFEHALRLERQDGRAHATAA